MSTHDLTEAIEAGAQALAARDRTEGDQQIPWDVWFENSRQEFRDDVGAVLAATTPLIVRAVRASIAAEFDALAAKLTTSIARMEPGSDSDVTLRDRRAQMATAAQMVRDGGTA